MDAIDILGALLRRKTQQGGSGGQILKEQLGGNRPAAPSAAPVSRRSQRPMTVEESAKSLEDLLNVANDQHTSRRQGPAASAKPSPMPVHPQRVPAQPQLPPAVQMLGVQLRCQRAARHCQNVLGELAHGLRLTPDRCNEIHRQYDAPEIFR